MRPPTPRSIFFWFLALMGVAVIFVYVGSLPSTVQSGDTGELVANAFRYQVSHPSGYPLYTNLFFVWTHLFRWGTVFFRASLLNAILSAATLGLIAVSGKNRMVSATIAFCFAFSRMFWKYSELPDVFALNALFAAMMLWVFLNDHLACGKKTWSLTLLFFIGLSNHLSLVFLAPLVGWQLFLELNRKRVLFSLVSGASAFFLLYASLAAMHPSGFYSWGTLKGVKSITRHFLREEYGRTAPALAPKLTLPPQPAPPPVVTSETGSQFKLEIPMALSQIASGPTTQEFRFYLKRFLNELATDLWPVTLVLILFLAWQIRRREVDGRTLVLLGILVAYAYLVFSMVKIVPDPKSAEIVDRFNILPWIILCFAAAEAASKASPKSMSSVVAILLVMGAGINFSKNRSENDFSKNTIVEDYAINFLNVSAQPSPVVVLAEDDTRYFALRYAQQVLGLHPEVLVLSPTLLFHSWYVEKVRGLYPAFVFDEGKAESLKSYDLDQDLLMPNLPKFDFVIPKNFSNLERYHITYLGLGRKIQLGSGLSFDENSLERLQYRSTAFDLKTNPAEYDPFRELYSEYAFYPLAKGKMLATQGDWKTASSEFLKALDEVPYCIPAAENLCRIQESVKGDASSCQERLYPIRAGFYNYFSQTSRDK